MFKKFTVILMFSLILIVGMSAISAENNNDTAAVISNAADLEVIAETSLTNDSFETTQSDSNESGDESGVAKTLDTQITTNNTEIPKTTDFYITLSDSNGTALANQSVIFNINNANFTKTTNESGIASLKINLAADTYNMTVYYLGNSTYAPSEASFQITSYQIPVKFSVKSTKILRGSYFVMYLYDSQNNPLINQKITFTINGKTYTRTTNSKGLASLKISLASGTYKMKIAYAGGAYKSVSKTVSITTYKRASVITLASKTVYRGKYFTVTLKDKSGNVLTSQKVYFKISGKTYTRTTNSNGKASLKITLKAKNYYVMKVVYKGSVSYKSTSKSVKLVVKSNTVYGQLLVKGKTVTRTGKTYILSTSNKNAVLVKSGGTLTLKNSNIVKKGDVSSSKAESSDFYGTNAAVLVTSKSKLYIQNTKITTNAKGANAIFVSNLDSSSSGATAYVTNVVIDTYKDKSRGLDATYGGKIVAKNVTIYTRGGSCAALATDRGEGTVIVSNSKLYTGVGQTSGSGSPLIYSTGDITVSNSVGTSYVSQIACIEGKNSITLTDCDFTGYAKGNRYVSGKYVDLAGVFLYQSMSGDADVGVSKFTATNSKLTISSSSSYYKSAPMFYVTNTDANINLNNCSLSFGSGVLLKAAGQNQWGTSGSNGGDVIFSASNMKLTGKIIIDKISSLKLTLTKTTYKGCINPSGSYGTTKVTIKSGSTWTLTGNSYVTSLSNEGTINYGSYTLYVNGVAYSASNPYKG